MHINGEINMDKSQNITQHNISSICTGQARTESTSPSAYRLAKKQDGTLILQVAYLWQEGISLYGHEWRDIPTVNLES